MQNCILECLLNEEIMKLIVLEMQTHYNHVLLQIYTKILANKNSYLSANTFYTEDIINTIEVT